ncbi:hypothetical protein [Pseudomonas poae]|uniref:Transposase n=1 Tax=Pseudomonas poae TaxID=200451 RepID=A0ABY0RRN8_9PSED|nr:hypothetical protein [Pseudomonas poae]SDO34193.1 hypothetical protein SAMN04490208_3447 [Pseudomonas poae]
MFRAGGMQRGLVADVNLRWFLSDLTLNFYDQAPFRLEPAWLHSVNRCAFTYPKPQISLAGRFKDLKGDLLVLWYGSFTPNARERTVPLVNVHFRNVDAKGQLGSFHTVPIGLPYLSYFQIGTVWREGSLSSDTQMENLPEQYLDFTPNKWKFVQATEMGLTSAYSTYELPSSIDSWLIEFKGTGDETVLIPCVELLVRLYGRSSETSRILTTYPWDEVQKRFFFDHSETWEKNVVKLQPKIRESEAVFLAHMRHDEYARYQCKKLYADLESAFNGTQNLSAPFGDLKIAPWFTGLAKVRARGFWINGRKTFLCLRLTGASEPLGPELEVYRPDYSTEAPSDDNEDDGGVFIKRPTKTLPLDQKAELTNDQASDPDIGTHILLNESFEVLGERRTINKRIQRKPGERGKKILPTGDAVVLSAGDPSERGSGVGKAEIVDVQPWESSGVLTDVWQALCALRNAYSTVIDRVEWLTLDGQRGTVGPAKLVLLKEFDDEDEVSPEQSKWLYLEPKLKILRGVQIVRIICGERHFYLFETQRRPLGTAKNDAEPAEEKSQGFLIELSLPSARVEVKQILAMIRRHQGKFRVFRGNLRNPCVSFNHSKNADDELLYFTCLKNNFEKLGVFFPRDL